MCYIYKCKKHIYIYICYIYIYIYIYMYMVYTTCLHLQLHVTLLDFTLYHISNTDTTSHPSLIASCVSMKLNYLN